MTDYGQRIMNFAGHLSLEVPAAQVEGPFVAEKSGAAVVKVWMPNGYGVHLRTGGKVAGETVMLAPIKDKREGSGERGTRADVAFDMVASAPDFVDCVTIKDVALILSDLGALDAA